MPGYQDDLNFSELKGALEEDIKVMKAKTSPSLIFGPVEFSRVDYIGALELLLSDLREDKSGGKFVQDIQNGFMSYEVYGDAHWGEIFLTSYFEPILEGSRKPDNRFSAPIHGIPNDFVEVDLASFSEALGEKLKTSSGRDVLRGQLIGAKDNLGTPKVVALPDRAGIVAGIFKGAPVLAWTDPIDSFFLHIQGSGVVRLREGGELKIGYAGQNGYPYVPIGKFLTDKVSKEKITQQVIESHLRSLPRDQANELMNKNPSYIFFRPLKSSGITNFGTELVSGRTIATDASFFPKGALAFLEFEKPVFASADATEPSSFTKVSRFVLDQDTGGAIRGPHRVDLFWGKGAVAKQAAGVMRQKGKLVYLVPKLEWLRERVKAKGVF